MLKSAETQEESSRREGGQGIGVVAASLLPSWGGGGVCVEARPGSREGGRRQGVRAWEAVSHLQAGVCAWHAHGLGLPKSSQGDAPT